MKAAAFGVVLRLRAVALVLVMVAAYILSAGDALACLPPMPVKIAPTFQVMISDGREPVPGVRVVLRENDVRGRIVSEAMTDAQGNVEFNGNRGMVYSIRVELPGDGEGTTLTQDMTGWGKPAGPSAKPVIMGEFAARTNSILLESDAAAALKAWQVESCSSFGFTGWALWSWDTAEQDPLGFPHWYALRETGLVNQALSPANRPDPCQN